MTTSAPLLIELGCEELPPKDLPKLSQSLAETITTQLSDLGLAPEGRQVFVTPRRLAVSFTSVLSESPAQETVKRGPAVKSAFDANNQPTPAAQGFAHSLGVTIDELATIDTDKGPCLGLTVETPGNKLSESLTDAIEIAMKRLPISKRMRWGDGEHEFVRPIHWLITLHGDTVIPVTLLGINSGRLSQGHRIHHPEPVGITAPGNYATDMEKAYVLVDPEQRQQRIQAQLDTITTELDAAPVNNPGLLAEVNGLVEWPVALHGRFDEKYLTIPHEVLTISMESHQRYFSLRDKETGAYLNRFITVANLESEDPGKVIEGNERVIEPRFADAAFFWDKDQQRPLADYLPLLDKVIFHKDIGSQGERVQRLIALSQQVALAIGADTEKTQRIATLAKCDLLTDMVQEFPELQGSMGKYYAAVQGEDDIVSAGIESHYAPRFSGDALPDSREATAVAIAEKMDTIASLFSIEQYPTGSKDPYALRRAALGIIRMLIEEPTPYSLDQLINDAIWQLPAQLRDNPTSLAEKTANFMIDRYRNFAQQHYSAEQINAVLSARTELVMVDAEHRLNVLSGVTDPDQLTIIANAAKRSRNLLSEHQAASAINESLLSQPAEKSLFSAVKSTQVVFAETDDYRQRLNSLSALAPAVDQFFVDTMIMDDNLSVRKNRLALLAEFVELAESDYHLSALSKQ